MKKIQDLKLGVKFVIAFLIVGILPMLIMGLPALNTASGSLYQAAFNQLEAVQKAKKEHMDEYFKGLFVQMDIFAHTQDVYAFYDKLVEYHHETRVSATGNYDVTTPEYNDLWKTYGAKLRDYQENSGVYDVFLICAAHGHVMYSNKKEGDLGENLGHGRYKNTNLAKLWQTIGQSGKPAVVDMAPYAPSENAPAFFAGYPIYRNDVLAGIIAFQIPLSQINQVMSSRAGMGKTGESYLVGPDSIMRSDSYLKPDTHSVTASFSRPQTGSADTEAVREALAGHSGHKLTKNYIDEEVLSAYAPLHIKDLTWAMVSEIDTHEAFESVRRIKYLIVAITLAGLVCITLAALAFTRSITNPVRKGVLFAKTMSEGDLSQVLDIDRTDEIGVLAKAMNQMSANLSDMFKELSQGVAVLSSSSTELSAISSQMKAGAEGTSDKSNTVAAAAEEMSASMVSVAAASEQASANIHMVATATEEMSATINEIAQSAEKGRSVTNDAVKISKEATMQVNDLGQAARQIGQVTETIADISSQTNLLALNATIEAARAGQAGKGFAVVASEIKELARQTDTATQEIRERVEGIQNTTRGTVEKIEKITAVINDVNAIVTSIASAIQEQSIATLEITRNISQAAQGIGEVNENVAQASAVSEEIARDIGEVSQSSKEMSEASGQVNISAGEMSRLAEKISGMTRSFKTR